MREREKLNSINLCLVGDRLMDSEKVLNTVEQLLQKQLTQIEQVVLISSWEGQSYKDIEENTGYVIGYLRDIGSGIWKELSEVMQRRVTKKNLPLILERFQQNDSLVQQRDLQIDSNPPSEDTFATTPNDLSFPSAPVPFNSRLYIKRPPCEKLARAEIARQGCLLRIKAPQKMGKSSLLNQVMAQADSLGLRIAYLDFKDAVEQVFDSINLTLRWFCAAICQQLNLPPNLDYYWDEDMGSKMSCKLFIESYILQHIDRPLVLAINELNQVFEHPQTAVDFLPLIRSFHEQSKRSTLWQKLRIVLVYSTDIYVPLKIDRSPFNVGLSLKLPQFDRQQVSDLAQRYELNWQGKEVEQLMSLVGGHPYLINIALYYLSQEIVSLERLLIDAAKPTGIYSQHLQSYLILLQQEPQLMSAMERVVNSSEAIELNILIAYKLKSMGLIQLEGFAARPSYELYRLYFSEVLKLKEN